MIYMYSGPDAVLTNAINLHSRVEHPKTQVCCVLIDPILKNQQSKVHMYQKCHQIYTGLQEPVR